MADGRIETLREQAWDYFQLHASQRIATFNFFVVLSGLALNALVATLKPDFVHHWVGVAVGVLLVILSFTFWKLDQRNRQLIRLAEDALMSYELETALPPKNGEPHALQLFSREECRTSAIRQRKSRFQWPQLFSYALCFRIVFSVFALAGFGGIIGATWLSFGQVDRTGGDWLREAAVPPAVVQSVREADLAYQAQAYYAAGLVLRNTVEELLRFRNPHLVNEANLADRLQTLSAQGVLTRSTVEAALSIPVFRSSSAVGSPTAGTTSATEVRLAREVVRQVVEAFYTNPAKLRAIQINGSGSG